MSQQDPELLRKRLKWTATKRGWNEAGDFLTEWVEDGGLDKLDAVALPALDRLLQCDDMFLMGIVLGNKETPPELDTHPSEYKATLDMMIYCQNT